MIHIYNTLSNEHKTIHAQGKLKNILPDFNFSHALMLKEGHRVDENYNVQSDDVLYIRVVPAAVSGTVLTVLAVTGVVIAGAGVGYAIYNNNKIKEEQQKAQRNAKNLADAKEQLPFLRGAKNKNALGNAIQYVMGNVYNVPYMMTDGFYSIDGTDGEKQYWNVVLSCGYNGQLIQKLCSGSELIQEWNDTVPQSGVYGTKAGTLYHDENNVIEITQNGQFVKEYFRQKVKSNLYGAELKHPYGGEAEPIIKQCADYTQKVEVCIEFPSLRQYDTGSEVWKERSVTVVPEWSNDGGQTWKTDGFTFGNGNVITKNSKKTIRFTATKTFSASESYGKNISVRLTRQNPKLESNSQEDVYWLYMNCFCYDNAKSNSSTLVPCVLQEGAENLTMIGLRFIANESTKDILDEFNVMSFATARTISASGIGSRATTRNPVEWVLDILTSNTHRPSKYNDSELDIQSFKAAKNFCDENHLYTDGIVSQGIKKRDLLNTILGTINATLFINADGKLEIVIDKAETLPVALLNSENIKSITYAKDLSRKPDGAKLTFTNRQNWSIDSRYCMLNGADNPSDDSILTEQNIQYVTDPDHIYKIGQRALREQVLQPKTITAEVGLEGDYYPLYSLVLLQMQQFRQGLKSSVISQIIRNADGEISAIEISDYVIMESNLQYGVVINAVSPYGRRLIYAQVVTNAGKTRTLQFANPLSEGLLPEEGNTLSFGYLNADGTFDRVTNKMKIYGITRTDNGVSLLLKDYNPALYETGRIPEYKSNLSIQSEPNRTVPSVSQEQLIESLENVRTITSVTVYYRLSETNETPAKSSFITEVPTMTSTYRFLWTYTRYGYRDGTYKDTDIVLSGVYGQRGESGSGYILDISPDSTPIFANPDGTTTVPSLQFGAYLFHDAEDLSAQSTFKAYVDNVEVGIWNGSIVTIDTRVFADDTTQIKIVGTFQSIERTAFAVVTKIYGNTIYQLLPSAQMVKVTTDGEIIPPIVTVERRKITNNGYYEAGEDEGVVYGRTIPGGSLQKVGYAKVEPNDTFDPQKVYYAEFEPFVLEIDTVPGSGESIVLGNEDDSALVLFQRNIADNSTRNTRGR